MSFRTPPHKHVGDEGKPGQTVYLEMDPKRVFARTLQFYERFSTPGHLSSSDNIPSPTGLKYQGAVSGRISGSGPNLEEIPKQRTNGDRMLETFAGAAACKLWWWPTDNGR